MLGLGGVIGGAASGCTDATVNVFIESAFFDPLCIAATGRKFAIESDARYRFERGVDPQFVIPGLELATQLVLQLCGGTASDVCFAGAVPESQVRSFIERLTGGGGSPIDQALAEAKAVLEEGDHETAAAIFKEIVDHDPNSAAAHAGYARALIAAGKTNDAHTYIAGLSEALRASTDVSGVISALELAAETGDTAAADELRAKLAQDPGDHQTRYELALALYGQGKAEEAVTELVEIVRRKRDWNEEAARKQLLKIFEALGHTDPVTVAGRRKLSAVLFS